MLASPLRRSRAEALRGAGVKLLLDENLSDRIISRVVDLFPDSTHVNRSYSSGFVTVVVMLVRVKVDFGSD